MNRFITLLRELNTRGHELNRTLPRRIESWATGKDATVLRGIETDVSAYFTQISLRIRQITLPIFLGLIAILIPLLLNKAGGIFQWLYYTFSAGSAVLLFLIIFTASPVFGIIREIQKLPDKHYRPLIRIFWINLDLVQVGFNLILLLYISLAWSFTSSTPIVWMLALIWMVSPWLLYLIRWEIAYLWTRIGQIAVLLSVTIIIQASPVPMHHYQAWAQRKGAEQLRPELLREVTNEWDTLMWFTQEGASNIWYSGNDESGYRLFSGPGYDPQSNEKLRAVRGKKDKERIEAWLQKQASLAANAEKLKFAEMQRQEELLKKEREETAARAMEEEMRRRIKEAEDVRMRIIQDYVSTDALLTNSKPHALALIVIDSATSSVSSSRLSAELFTKGMQSASELFTANFTSSEYLKSTLHRRPRPDIDFNMSQFAEVILVAEAITAPQKQEIVEGSSMLLIEISCKAYLINTKTGQIKEGRETVVRGIGFNDSTAHSMAVERAEAKLAAEFVTLFDALGNTKL